MLDEVSLSVKTKRVVCCAAADVSNNSLMSGVSEVEYQQHQSNQTPPVPPPIHSNRAYVSQWGGGCVHVCVWGGDHTVYTLSRSGIVILTDVIESNEIGVSQRASTVSNAWSQCETALRTA